MITRKVTSQGFDLNFLVPETTDEYNSLAPKRLNPVLEDAILSTWYRNGANRFRDALCEHLEKEVGIARTNTGTEDKPVWEPEGKFVKRASIAWQTAQGLEVGSKAGEDAFYAHFTPAAQTILDGIKFDPSEREAVGAQPAISKAALKLAEEIITKGKGQTAIDSLNKLLGTSSALTGDSAVDVKTLAKAIAANEKRKREIQEAQTRSELGVG